MRPSNTKESLLKNTIIEDDCWLYQGALEHGGHCKVRWEGKKTFIHRVSAQIHWGFDLDSSFLILHRCNHPNCWNPAHLYEGTKQDNAQDAILAGTFHYTKVTTQCPQGHEFTPENTGINSSSGKKYCKECNRQRARDRRIELGHVVEQLNKGTSNE